MKNPVIFSLLKLTDDFQCQLSCLALSEFFVLCKHFIKYHYYYYFYLVGFHNKLIQFLLLSEFFDAHVLIGFFSMK